MRNAGTAFPDCAEFIIGRRFAPTRWLHPGYGDRYAATSGPGDFKYCDVTACAAQ
jgi:hypothetical protein